MKFRLLPAVVIATGASALAQSGDAPPVDVKQILQGLRQFKEQNETSVKGRRTSAWQQVTAAAASNERASQFWAECVLAVQFAGVDHQATAVHDWKLGEGEGLRTKEGANAARLHLLWLGLTIQHSTGTETKQLLNTIIEFTRQVDADDLMIERVADQIDKAKERTAGMKRQPVNKTLAEETHAKKTHDSIMRMSVVSSPVARRLQITEMLGDVGGKKKKGDTDDPANWEPVPGNVTGIYNAIILPEFRATKDPRLLDYWDLEIKKAQQRIEPGMADYDERQWTQVRQPRLLWSRAQDVLLIGQRNRAVTEMFNLIKTYPLHPDNAAWISQLESLVAPPAPGAVPTATLAPVPPTAPGAR